MAGSISVGVIAGCSLLASASTGHALDARMTRILKRIDPDTRLEQVCDIEAMRRIGKPYKVDRAKSDVTSHPKHSGDTLTADGAAFRSRGQWYGLSFACKGTPDHLGVVSFTFKIGDRIPASRWSEFGLWR